MRKHGNLAEASVKYAKQSTLIFWRSSPFFLVYFVFSSFFFLNLRKFSLFLLLFSEQRYTRVLRNVLVTHFIYPNLCFVFVFVLVHNFWTIIGHQQREDAPCL